MSLRWHLTTKSLGRGTMGCCNGKRALMGRPLPFSSRTTTGTVVARTMISGSPVKQAVGFEYMGETAMTVLGPITRTQYRFAHKGARIEVDQRDAPYLSGVPNLRRAAKAAAEPRLNQHP